MRSYPVQALLLFILAAALASRAFAKPNTLVFTNHDAIYCPYTLCDGNRNGFVVEFVKQIFASKGYEVVIRNEPWNRALALAETGKVTGVVAVAKETTQNLIFPNTEVSQILPTYYTSAKSSWTYHGKGSLASVKFGLVKGQGYERVNPVFGEFMKSDRKGRPHYWRRFGRL